MSIEMPTPTCEFNTDKWIQNMRGAESAMARGNFKQADKHLLGALRTAEAGNNQEAIFDTLVQIADTRLQNGNWALKEDTLQHLNRSLDLGKQLYGEKSGPVAAVHINLGHVLGLKNECSEAEHHLDTAHDLISKVPEEQRPYLLYEMSMQYYLINKYEKGLAGLDELLALPDISSSLRDTAEFVYKSFKEKLSEV